jgi:glycosidase
VDEAATYFGENGSELNLVFSFDVNQAMWLSLARQHAGPLAAAIEALPHVDEEVHWANFARLHDEANVGRLPPEQRQEVFEAFGASEDVQIFERGLRRRLAPMLDGDGDRIRLVHSLVLSLPGAPVLYYGEEIGMGENLELEGRLSTRSTMQWNDLPDGGFGPHGGERSRRRPPDGVYGPEHVNVVEQRADEGSLLHWVSRAVRARRQILEIGAGSWSVVESDDDAVLAHRLHVDGTWFVAVHNLAEERRQVRIEVGRCDSLRTVLAADGADVGVDGGDVDVDLPRYGHVWLQSRDTWP